MGSEVSRLRVVVLVSSVFVVACHGQGGIEATESGPSFTTEADIDTGNPDSKASSEASADGASSNLDVDENSDDTATDATTATTDEDTETAGASSGSSEATESGGDTTETEQTAESNSGDSDTEGDSTDTEESSESGSESETSDDDSGGDDCPTPMIRCDGDCIDPDSNEDFCGARADCMANDAGEECPARSSCISGQCREHALEWKKWRNVSEELVGGSRGNPRLRLDEEGRALLVYADRNGLHEQRSSDLETWTESRLLVPSDNNAEIVEMGVRGDGGAGHVVWRSNEKLFYRSFNRRTPGDAPDWASVHEINLQLAEDTRIQSVSDFRHGSLLAFVRYEGGRHWVEIVELKFGGPVVHHRSSDRPSDAPSWSNFGLSFGEEGHAAVVWRAPGQPGTENAGIQAFVRRPDSVWQERTLLEITPATPPVIELDAAVDQDGTLQLIWTDTEDTAIHSMATPLTTTTTPDTPPAVRDLPNSQFAESIHITATRRPTQHSVVRFAVSESPQGAAKLLRSAELDRSNGAWRVRDYPCETPGVTVRADGAHSISGDFMTYDWSGFFPAGPIFSHGYFIAFSPTEWDNQHCDATVVSARALLFFAAHPTAQGRGVAYGAIPDGGLPPGPTKITVYELAPRP